MNEEERKAHYRMMGRLFVWSGWIVAFIALFLGGHLLSGLSEEVKRLKAENAALKASGQSGGRGAVDRRVPEGKPGALEPAGQDAGAGQK